MLQNFPPAKFDSREISLKYLFAKVKPPEI